MPEEQRVGESGTGGRNWVGFVGKRAVEIGIWVQVAVAVEQIAGEFGFLAAQIGLGIVLVAEQTVEEQIFVAAVGIAVAAETAGSFD